jgi:hypothetical protein
MKIKLYICLLYCVGVKLSVSPLGSYTEDVEGEVAEENVWTHDRGSNKTARYICSVKYYITTINNHIREGEKGGVYRHITRRWDKKFFSRQISLCSLPQVALGGLVVSVLATGPKVRGFNPGRGRWIFKGDKNPQHNFLRRGSKAVSRHVKEPYGHE